MTSAGGHTAHMWVHLLDFGGTVLHTAVRPTHLCFAAWNDTTTAYSRRTAYACFVARPPVAACGCLCVFLGVAVWLLSKQHHEFGAYKCSLKFTGMATCYLCMVRQPSVVMLQGCMLHSSEGEA
jgi:hypothetical protein